MKFLLILWILTGCGSLQLPKSGAGTDTNTSTDIGTGGASASTTDSQTTEQAAGVVQAPADAKALAFSNTVKLDKVRSVTSAVVLKDTVYFLGTDADKNPVLGSMGLTGSGVALTPLGSISANNIYLNRAYTLIPGATDKLYLARDGEIDTVDPTTLQATGKVESECALEAPLTYIQDGRFETVWKSTLTECGMVDGATLTERKPLVASATGNPLPYDASGQFTFGGSKVYEFSRAGKYITVMDSTFATQATYSTSAFLYNGPDAVLVVDDSGAQWMFGCDAQENCYRTDITMVTQ